LCNPRNELVQVAQHGLGEEDVPVPFMDALDGITPAFRDKAYLTSLSSEMGESWADKQNASLLVLPLFDGKSEMGMIILCIDSDWEPDAETLDFMTNISHVVSGVVSRYIVNEALSIRELELEESRADAIRRLGTASEYRDNETGLHVMRMTHYSAAIAKAMGLSEEDREQLTIAASMHDVGKIGISDAILLKPGKLNKNEFETMKSHTNIGGDLLDGKDTLINAAREIALTHHEHWDGTGYPYGLKGEEIPLFGRICSIADVFDALVSKRTYKEAWELKEATDYIQQESGGKFDPDAVIAFHDALPDILRIKELYSDEVIDPNRVLSLPAIKTSKDEWVSWNDSFSIGIDIIDEHHRYLFDLVNKLHRVITDKHGAREVARVLHGLSQYAQIHFRAEEKMMDHYGFAELEHQKHQHQHFESKLKTFYDELHINPLTAQFDMITYLKEWLVRHIVVEDGRLSELVGMSVDQ